MSVDLATAVETARATGVLHLNNLGLTSFPSSIPALLPNLTRLDLSGNELTYLPAEIGKLHNLEQLWLNDNPLLSLPEEIDGCISLRIIDLRRTRISRLPGSLGTLENLIELSLSQTRIDAEMQNAYAKGGTLKLLSILNERETRRELEAALRSTLSVEVYREAADTIAGRARIEEVIQEVMAEFAENTELKTVIRNAGRVFNPVLGMTGAVEVRANYTELQRDNVRKALAADVELRLRATYYDRIDVTKVEGMVKDIMSHLPSLEDAAFLLENAKRLLPKEAKEIRGAQIYVDLVALREALAAERAQAIQALVSALTSIYADREPNHIASLAKAVSGYIKSADDILMLASDAAEIFPPEFASAKPKKIYAAFKTSKKEKGL